MNINLSLETIVSLTGASSQVADKNIVIKRIASLETAASDDLAVILERGDASVFDAVSLEKIKNCKAGVILASTAVVPEKNYLLVPDVLTAYTKLVDYVQKTLQQQDEFQLTPMHALVSKHACVAQSAAIGAGAVICAGATIGENVTVSAQCFIGHNCVIGAHVLLHPGVKVLDDCLVGDGTIVHAGAVIGSDGFGYEVSQKGLRKIPQIGIVVIGKMAEIGANCTIDRASFDKTMIGNMVKMDNGVHIAHNVSIGDGTAILAQTGIAGSAKIGVGCQIGGQVAIKNDIVIGNGVKIVSKSAVLDSLKDGDVVCGIPAIPFMQWKRLQVMISKLPEWSKLVVNFKGRVSFWQKVKLFFKGE